jgi:hypothetical protein
VPGADTCNQRLVQSRPFLQVGKRTIQRRGLPGLESQSLIGQGLDNGKISARPVYPAFLVLVHVLTGQDYDLNMAFQAAVLGIFPALMYLLGAALLPDRGPAAAALTMYFWHHGHFTTELLDLANAKQMLPDLPTALGIAACLIVCIGWFRAPTRSRNALLVGGLVAVSVYLRPTALGIVPAIVLLAAVAFRRLPRRKYAAAVALMLAGYAAFSLPWEARAQVAAGELST